MWLCNVIYFCVSNCVCCAQGVAEEQLRLMLPPCLNNKIKKLINMCIELCTPKRFVMCKHVKEQYHVYIYGL